MFQATAGRPSVSVVVPARNEAETVGGIVAMVAAMGPLVSEVLVVDDGSSDDTAAVAARAGGRVIDAARPVTGGTVGPGKGRAMWLGLRQSTGDIVVFCDADVSSFHPGYVTGLVEALVERPGAALAKGTYRRGGTGGRVNELVARPALDLLHPHLAHVSQPLGGEYAGWRQAFEQVPFVSGYGVDVGLLIDLAQVFGTGAVVETHLGWRHHRNRPLEELRPQARAVLEVILHRAGRLPWPPTECPPLSSAGAVWASSSPLGDAEPAQTPASPA